MAQIRHLKFLPNLGMSHLVPVIVIASIATLLIHQIQLNQPSTISEEHTQKRHIIFFPSIGMGHLIPITEFAKRFIKYQNVFGITFIVHTIGPPSNSMKATLEALPSSINHIFLPPVDISKADTSSVASLHSFAINESLPFLRASIHTLISSGSRLVAFFADPAAFDVFGVANEFHIPTYALFTSSAMSLSLYFYIPKLDKLVTGEFRDMTEPVKIPGCVPVRGRDLFDPLLNRKSELYKWFLSSVKRIESVKGIAVDTFQDLERGALRALTEEWSNMPSIYPIGPIIRESKGSNHDCLKWLDNQPTESVLFVSFGSGGTLSQAQINELASGLEMSGQRFLWVVRCPNEESKAGAFFSHKSKQDPLEYFPKGFVERTKKYGLFLPDWAPQTEILSHGSIGGFLTHCGWNSILESIINGVPMITWPLYSEQRMTAVMLIEDVKVALRLKVDDNILIVREEISNAVIDLMEGEAGVKIRKQVKELQGAAKMSLEEDGSSTTAVAKLAQDLMAH